MLFKTLALVIDEVQYSSSYFDSFLLLARITKLTVIIKNAIKASNGIVMNPSKLR